jgi:hypothetical protein
VQTGGRVAQAEDVIALLVSLWRTDPAKKVQISFGEALVKVGVLNVPGLRHVTLF